MERRSSALCWLLFVASLAPSGCSGDPKPQAQSPAQSDPCADFDLDVKKVWSEESKIQLRAELMGKWGGEVGSDVAQRRAESVETQMDNITRDWVMLRRSACLDHFKRGLGTETAYQTRVDCFNRVLERQRAALAQTSDATAMVSLNQELNTCR